MILFVGRVSKMGRKLRVFWIYLVLRGSTQVSTEIMYQRIFWIWNPQTKFIVSSYLERIIAEQSILYYSYIIAESMTFKNAKNAFIIIMFSASLLMVLLSSSSMSKLVTRSVRTIVYRKLGKNPENGARSFLSRFSYLCTLMMHRVA